MYAVAEAAGAPVAGTGLADAPLRDVCEGSLKAIVSDHDDLTPDPTPELLWRYEEVVERLAEAHPVLPARFGSALADDTAVRELLTSRCEQLVTSIDGVRGAVELAVRALSVQPIACTPPSGPDKGAAYLRERLALRRRVRRVASDLAPLDDLSRMSRRRAGAAPAVLVCGDYLVDRDNVGEFAQAVARLDERLGDVELVCTGPWPPYSFAGESSP
jgi:hypothetical protein